MSEHSTSLVSLESTVLSSDESRETLKEQGQ